MSCSSCCNPSAEIVPVTINTTALYVDDLPAIHRTENFGYDDDPISHKSFELEFYPYEGKSVEVFRNSGAQRYGIDFTVQNGYVILTVPLVDSNDKIYVRYFHVDGVTQSSGAVGTIVSSAGNSLAGYLYMDGVTSRAWSSYTQLYDWFYDATYGPTRRSALLLSNDGTNFVLKALSDVSYVGEELVTLNKFISTGA